MQSKVTLPVYLSPEEITDNILAAMATGQPLVRKGQPVLLGPGIFKNIPEAWYHSLPYIGSSVLKKFAVNPFTCHDPVEGIPPVGSASHLFSLEGKDKFVGLYAVAPEFPCPSDQNPKGWKNTNKYKDLWGTFLLNNAGKIVLNAEEGAAVLGMDASLREHPVTKRIMNRGANELTAISIDTETGLYCKARIDDYPGAGIANDYKTTNSLASFIGIYRRLRYSIQAGHYVNVLEACGESIKAFIFCVAEYNEPYGVRTGRIGMPEDENQIDRLQASRDEAKRLLVLYKQCKERNFWPNFEIPRHIFDIDQIQPQDLLEDWNGIEGRYM